jgi:hypothetical protein
MFHQTSQPSQQINAHAGLLWQDFGFNAGRNQPREPSPNRQPEEETVTRGNRQLPFPPLSQTLLAPICNPAYGSVNLLPGKKSENPSANEGVTRIAVAFQTGATEGNPRSRQGTSQTTEPLASFKKEVSGAR